MKILDKYLLKSFLITFATVFVILFFIFILQVVWLFISELAGKGLDFIMIMKFLLFAMPRLIPLVLPLSVLLASIMTYGSLSENYEFAAIKSSGISFQRMLRSNTIFIIFLSLISFFFANNVIPYAEYKFINFRRNIAQIKPAMAIAEGQFSEIGNYTIKVKKKSGDKGNYLTGVTIHKKLDFVFNYNNNKNDFNLFSNVFRSAVLDNFSNQNYYNGKFDYSQGLKILDEGKVSFGALYEKLLFEAENFGSINLDYQRTTASTYLEFQAKYNKFDFILGSRAEKYEINGKTTTGNLIPFDQFRWFPNATVQYNFSPQIFLNMNYNKKITLPSTSALNPNNTTYQNQNLTTVGNPNLQPTIFDNFEFKISAFDYAFIGYSISNAKNQVINRVLVNNDVVSNTTINVPELKIHNFNIGLPIPYMLFTKGLKETLKFDFNPDKINFLYAYAGYQLHQIPDVNTKGFWIINLMSQIVLPKDIKFIGTDIDVLIIPFINVYKRLFFLIYTKCVQVFNGTGICDKLDV